MGTSNWQQVPFCIDALMKIEPRRVLDVGVGFGRWGMIVREFCDVWFGRVMKDQWTVQLEGIEAFEKSITDYHRSFYNQIHIGDASDVLPTLPGPWSVTIYGDVLEHFTKERAQELLNISLDRSDYVIVNIPIGEEHPQGEAYGNTFERHLSSWQPEDFRPFGLTRQAMFKDYIGRDYGSFVLSRTDPRRLSESLFSRDAVYDGARAVPMVRGDLARITRRIEEQSFELAFVKHSASYRLASRLRRNVLGKVARVFKSGSQNTLRLNIEGAADGVLLMGVHAAPGEPAVPWDFVERAGGILESHPDGAYGRCLRFGSGSVTVRTGKDPVVRLHKAPAAAVEVTFNAQRETLGRSVVSAVTFYPGRTPMVPVPQAASMIEATPGAARAAESEVKSGVHTGSR